MFGRIRNLQVLLMIREDGKPRVMPWVFLFFKGLDPSPGPPLTH